MQTYRDQATLSRRLATICTDVPIAMDLDYFLLSQPDLGAVREIFKELEFTKLVRDLPEEDRSEKKDYRLVTDWDTFQALMHRLKETRHFAIDVETTSLNPMHAKLVGISVSCAPCQAFYIPLGHRCPEGARQLATAEALGALKPILEDPEIRKVGQNIKYDWIVLRRCGIELQGIPCDTMVASYLLNPTKHNHNLSEIAREYLDITMTDYAEVVGSGNKALSFDQVDFERARDYSCDDAAITFQLSQLLLPRLREQGSEELFHRIEIPLFRVLAKMEMNGVKVDVRLLEEFSKEVETQLQNKAEKIHALAGEPFNINSSQQLGRVLFEKLKLPMGKKT